MRCMITTAGYVTYLSTLCDELAAHWERSMAQEAGDLVLRANARVLITERTSDDWYVGVLISSFRTLNSCCSAFRWTGELDGKSGLFPASYVTVL